MITLQARSQVRNLVLVVLACFLSTSPARGDDPVNISGNWYAELGTREQDDFQRFLIVLHHDVTTHQVTVTVPNREIAEAVPFAYASSGSNLDIQERMLHGLRMFRFRIDSVVTTAGVPTGLVTTPFKKLDLNVQDGVDFAGASWQQIGTQQVTFVKAPGNHTIRHLKLKFEVKKENQGNTNHFLWEGTYHFSTVEWDGTPPSFGGQLAEETAEPAYAVQHCRPVGCEARVTKHHWTERFDEAGAPQFGVNSFVLKYVPGLNDVGGFIQVPSVPEYVSCPEISATTYLNAFNSGQTQCNIGSPPITWDQGPAVYSVLGMTSTQDVSEVLALLNQVTRGIKEGTLGAPTATSPFAVDFLDDGVCYASTGNPAAASGCAAPCANGRMQASLQQIAGLPGTMASSAAYVRNIRTQYDFRMEGGYYNEDTPGYGTPRGGLLWSADWMLRLSLPGYLDTHERFEFPLNTPIFWMRKEASTQTLQFIGNGECDRVRFSALPAITSNVVGIQPAFLKVSPTVSSSTPMVADHREGGRGWNVDQSGTLPIFAMASGKVLPGTNNQDATVFNILHRPGFKSSYWVVLNSDRPGDKDTHLIDAGGQMGLSPSPAGGGGPSSKVTTYVEGNFSCPVAYLDNDTTAAAYAAFFSRLHVTDRLTEPLACNASHTIYPMVANWNLLGGPALQVMDAAGVNRLVARVQFTRARPSLEKPTGAPPNWLEQRSVEFYDAAGVLINQGSFYPRDSLVIPASPDIPFGHFAFKLQGNRFYCGSIGFTHDIHLDANWHAMSHRYAQFATRMNVNWVSIAADESTTSDACTGLYPANASAANTYEYLNPWIPPLPTGF